MKQYKVDELRPKDVETLLAYLDQHGKKTSLEHTYWLELPDFVLTELQASHKDCGPHVVGLAVEKDWISCEFLVRTPKKLQCGCMQMANASQRVWIMETVDSILEKLSIEG